LGLCLYLLADKADYKVTVDGADFVVDSTTVVAPAAGVCGNLSASLRFFVCWDFSDNVFVLQVRRTGLKCLSTCDSSQRVSESEMAAFCFHPLPEEISSAS
jgi:hypothetical protein